MYIHIGYPMIVIKQNTFILHPYHHFECQDNTSMVLLQRFLKHASEHL